MCKHEKTVYRLVERLVKKDHGRDLYGALRGYDLYNNWIGGYTTTLELEKFCLECSKIFPVENRKVSLKVSCKC